MLATTLAQTQVLARLPLQNLLKNELHADRTANAAFFFWAGLAWYLKPFAGILTDAFPLFGSRRKSYILLNATLATLSWLVLIVTPHEYRDLLFVVMVINTFMMVTSTVVGGYMVETAQANSGSGRLTALRQFVQQACWVVNGPMAGYLASIAFGWTAAACGGVMFLLVPMTLLFMREQRRRALRPLADDPDRRRFGDPSRRRGHLPGRAWVESVQRIPYYVEMATQKAIYVRTWFHPEDASPDDVLLLAMNILN